MSNKDELLILSKYLKNKERIEHSKRTAKLARELAEIYDIDKEKAYLAGFFHDIAKEVNSDKALLLSKEYNYTLSSSERLNKKLLHAPIGALIVFHQLEIQDIDISEAIRWHTTGKAQMTTLEKIIYLADCAEEGRKYPEAKKILELSKENLDSAMLFTVSFLMNNLIEERRFIDKNSVDCYNCYIQKK
jgi:predicted HD superfamily hydrolase involved in NAD metabolism